MTCHLHVRDINDFGYLETPEQPKFGILFSQALINHYVTYYRASASGYLTHLDDYVSYVATIMESVEGFDAIPQYKVTSLLLNAVGYLTQFIDYLDTLVPNGEQRVGVYNTATSKQRYVALLI